MEEELPTRKIVSILYVNDKVNIEVWTEIKERFVCIYKNKNSVFFSKILWTQFISYCDEKLKKNEKGVEKVVEKFGKKKEVQVSDDGVKITIKDNPPKELLLNANDWSNIMTIEEKVKNILDKKEGYYMLSVNTYIHVKKPAKPNLNVYVVLEKTDRKYGNKMYMSDKTLNKLCNYIPAINMCVKNGEEDTFKLEPLTIVEVYGFDYGVGSISLLKQDIHATPKIIFTLTELEWYELTSYIEDIFEVIQPSLMYKWCYRTLEGDILNVSDRTFTDEETCRYYAKFNVPLYDTCNGQNSLNYELHIDTYSFSEYSTPSFIPLFKWKHMSENIKTCTDGYWYMYKESCRRKGLHAHDCHGCDKFIVNEHGGKSDVIDLQKEVVNDLKYNPFAALTVYNFLLERNVTDYIHPNEDWNLTLEKYLPNARRNVTIENLLYACDLLDIISCEDEARLIIDTKDVNLKENELLECYRVIIKNILDKDLCCSCMY